MNKLGSIFFALTVVGCSASSGAPVQDPVPQIEPAGGDVWPRFATERFRAWYRPFDIAGELAGFSDAGHFSQLEFDRDGTAYRRAAGDAWLRLEGVAPGEAVVLSVASEGSSNFAYYVKRGPTPEGLFEGPSVAPLSLLESEQRELSFRAPPGRESLWLGWKRWKRAPDSRDATAGLRIGWLAVAARDDTLNLANRP